MSSTLREIKTFDVELLTRENSDDDFPGKTLFMMDCLFGDSDDEAKPYRVFWGPNYEHSAEWLFSDTDLELPRMGVWFSKDRLQRMLNK